MATTFGVFRPLGSAVLLAGALLGGCGQGDRIAVDGPGRFDQIRLGLPLPAELAADAKADGLGLSLRGSGRDYLSRQTKEEVIRAVVDKEGNVVAAHALTSWRREPISGPVEAKERFVIEARVPELVGPAARPADGAALDETLLAMARNSALRTGPRIDVPASWEQVAPALLIQLSARRTAQGLGPVDKPAETPAELLLVAEILLETIAVDDAEQLDRTIWQEMDIAAALRKVPAELPDPAAVPVVWERKTSREVQRPGVTFGLAILTRFDTQQTRLSGWLTHLGDGHVRLVIQNEVLPAEAE